MGRPQADSSDQQQQEYELQPQEYQYDPNALESTSTQHDFSPQTFEINYYESSQHDPCQSNFTDPQQQQQQQQQQQEQYQQPQQTQPQQQPQQYPPPQANQGYGPQTPQPAQFPLRNNPAHPPQGPGAQSRPAPFPPQSPNNLAAYPPQTIPTQHVQFPPAASPPVYHSVQNQAAAYPPQRPSGNYPGQVAPQPFPHQAAGQAFTQNAYQAPQPVSLPVQNNIGQGYGMASSPYKPSVQTPIGIPMGQQVQYNEGWRTGLFDCMEDPMNAVTTACFPCITFGQVAEIIDNGQTSCGTSGLLYGVVLGFIGLPCIMSCSYRTKLRAKYGLVEAPAPDWVTHFFCEPCALCQEYRELQKRGLDPAIGWQGNMMQQQQPQVAMMPPMNQKMMP